MKKILIIIMTMFLFNVNVSAKSLCDYNEQTELNAKVANIKVSYDVIDKTLHFADGDANQRLFKIQVLNVTDEFYIIVKNDINNEEITYNSTNAINGIISFEWDYVETVTNFTIQVYTTNKTNCADEKYKTFYLTTPRYNEYYKYSICSDLSDFYLCQEFVTFDKVNRDNFFSQINNYKNGEINNKGEEPLIENPTITDKLFEFINVNKWYIFGGIVVITSLIVIINKRKSGKQRELGL